MKTINVDITGNYYKIPVINEFPPVYDREVSQAELSMIYNSPSKCNFKAFKVGGEYIPPKKVAETFNPGGGSTEETYRLEFSTSLDDAGKVITSESTLYGKDGLVTGPSALYGKQVIIDPETKVIGVECFAGVTFSKELTIPSGVETIEHGAFFESGYKSQKSLILPNTVKNINGGAFQRATKMNVVLPDSVEYIGDHAFEDCYAFQQLSTFSTPANLKEIGEAAFYGCFDNNTTVTLNDGLEKIGDEAFCGVSQDSTSSYYIPESVTSMGEMIINYANDVTIKCPVIDTKSFYGMRSVGEVTLDGVKEIKESGFEGADLNNLIFGEGLEKIGDSAFKDFYLGWDAKTGEYLGNLILPSSLKSIGKDVFVNSKIQYIGFKNNTETLDISHFLTDFQGSSAEVIFLPNNISFGNGGGIHGAPKLTSICIGSYGSEEYGTESDITLANGCFAGNPNLSDINFCNKPKSGEITAHAFGGLDGITINCCWSEGEVTGAPWDATNATINYDVT